MRPACLDDLDWASEQTCAAACAYLPAAVGRSAGKAGPAMLTGLGLVLTNYVLDHLYDPGGWNELITSRMQIASRELSDPASSLQSGQLPFSTGL